MHRFRHYISLALGIALLYATAATAAQAKIKYGLWAITIQTQMDAMPMEIPAETIKKCIREGDLTPGSNKNKAGCKPVKVKRKGDSVSWTVSCDKDDHTLSGSGKITYSGNKMKGEGQFQAGGKDLPDMKMKLVYTGKRVGKCRN